MKPPDSRWFGLSLIICLALMTGTPASTRTPLSENTDIFLTVQGTTLKAAIPPSFIALNGVLGSFYSQDEINYLYNLLTPYDWDIDTAYGVLMCESKGNPEAINWNDKHKGCDGSFGLFQIACVHLENYGIENYTELFDAEKNIEISYDLWRKNGWSPWQNCLMN